MTTKQMEEFEDLAKPLVKWLNANGNPHSVIIIETDGARLMMGLCSVPIVEFIED